MKLQRRHLSIPNPLHQIKLSNAIEANWSSLQTHYAKSRISRSNTHYGNLLDECMRNCQDGQTIGIPIGPDTSLIISEIIGSEIDHLFQQRVPQVNGFRYVDDYYLYFDSFSSAEQACSTLHQILREFELDHNLAKTSITSLPEVLEKEWATELRIFDIRTNPTAQKNDIISYFSKAFDYSIKYPQDPVIKYAVTKSKTFNISTTNWGIYESLILKSMVVEPSTLQLGLEILLSYELHGYLLNRNKITDTITDIILNHAAFNHCYELSWALWISKSLSITLDNRVSNALSQINNSMVALIALDLNSSGLISGLNTTIWQSYLTVSNMYEEQWLLNYEAQIKGWLTGTFFTSGSLFSDLHVNGVEFYDSTRQVSVFTPTATSAMGSVQTRTSSNEDQQEEAQTYSNEFGSNAFTFY
ncbi:reverse transcriptase [compost metagenome]